MANDKQLCVFRLGGMEFGIEAGKVQEVLKAQEWTPVPLAPPGVQGVMNLRGQIVTVLDLHHRLTLPEIQENRSFAHMILHTRGEHVSLLVDAIGDVVEVDQETFEEPPPTLAREVHQLIKGAYKLKNQLLLVLDIEEALQVKN